MYSEEVDYTKTVFRPVGNLSIFGLDHISLNNQLWSDCDSQWVFKFLGRFGDYLLCSCMIGMVASWF